MDAYRQKRLEARARILKAVGNASRLLILEELAQGEKCVADLTQEVGSDISTVSKHLSLLKAVGLVKDDKRGNQVFYTLLAPCVLNFFDCVESVLEARVQHQIEMIG
ncbi:MAG: metalloregulator ArsR/SmtB family transcription factor [Desulfarculus sp.]|nr:metalloregulator ArsR/SmtB family transcription factor [Pseudomonadota bacterium]MBV1717938.1 metalloregulator ArsR/SmtB family transcription factor [Desulfarculus sp.]MBU4576596.1 metalloregulator ArsR/SmtB family transcription factor [Pseudomonadota bacterium]MBU4598075.1 metalloregulator ArsR/SmtB family transcription factor [Pseudomonadota bacterium]MBV1739448.1 metalloregulator ArsR/SmtB family transcription factor [Desulfarculus sp.]